MEADKDSIAQWDPEGKEWIPIWSGRQWSVSALQPHPFEHKLMILVAPDAKSPKELWQLDALSGQKSQVVLPSPLRLDQIALSPDGKTLAFVDGVDGQVRSCDLGTGVVQSIRCPSDVEHLSYKEMWYNDLDWSPDGQRLFYNLHTMDFSGKTLSYGSALFVASPDGRERKLLMEGHPDEGGKVLAGIRVGTA